MKYLKFILAGCFFGVILVKSEAVSWFRIFEMFHFQSIHMYGIIGCAVVLGVAMVKIIKATQLKDYTGEQITFSSKAPFYKANLIGGIIFGLGWALSGACPGPMFALLGYGCYSILIVIVGALIGTYVYGLLKNKLPH